MADDTNSTAGESQTTDANAGGQAAGDSTTGAATQTASTEAEQQQQTQQQSQSQTTDDDKVTKAEAKRQAEELVTKTVKRKLRAELIKRGIDPDAQDGEQTTKPTVDSVTKERDDAIARVRVFEAAEQVEEFIADKRNNVQVRNPRALIKFIRADYQFDDDGKVTNLKELIADAKRDAPELFGIATGSIDGGAGNGATLGADMNSLIRRAAGRQ